MVLIPRSAPKHSFGTGLRSAREGWPGAEPSPGPGHYGSASLPSSRRGRSAVSTFGASERCELRQTLCPGPGQYATKAQRSGPSYSHGQTAFERMPLPGDTAATPGPGAYQVLHAEAEGPKFSLVSARRAKDVAHPGPGHYDARAGFSSVPRRRTKPGFGFGTSSREPGSPHRTPGPGHYSLERKVGGGGWSILPRRTRTSLEPPGPGPGQHTLGPVFGE
mmetsp:Transcript_12911/g.38869  ORF Transcript_12911/g.38869 Transcript_12911/m.38869 type:complete len:220 (-) Transcript_12911:104-763(-)